jgi:hypothetical protein
MAGAVKMLDVGGIGAGKQLLGRLRNPHALPYGVRLKKTKLPNEAFPQKDIT